MTTKISTSSRFLNKTIRVISSLVIAIGMVFSSMPFVDLTVKAAGGTYVLVENPYTAIGTYRYNYSNGTYTDYEFRAFSSNQQTRMVHFYNTYNGVHQLGFCVKNDSNVSILVKNIIVESGNIQQQWTPNDLGTVYVGSDSYECFLYTVNLGLTYTLTSDVINISSNPRKQEVYDYAFGTNATDPLPDVNYGSIKDLAYSTKISGGSIDQNHDCITWYPYWDTNNNVAINWNMEIRVVPGTYTSDTQNGLFNLNPQNFVTNLGASVYVYQGAYSQGSIEVSWLRIKELLTPLQFATSGLFSFFDGEYWTKKGWMYQARYIDPENEYTSEWQNIYTVTSSSGKGVEDVIDPSTETNLPDFYNNVNDSYNDIFNTTSVVNNNYNQVYYVNNAPYVVNPSEEPEEPDSNTDKILEEILKVTIQIRQLIQQDQNDGDERQPDDTGLKDKDDELHDREQELIDDMDDKLEDIDTDVELISNSGFLSAANWVRVQYDHLTLNTPFELVIVFALVLGIALIFIGKVR